MRMRFRLVKLLPFSRIFVSQNHVRCSCVDLAQMCRYTGSSCEPLLIISPRFVSLFCSMSDGSTVSSKVPTKVFVMGCTTPLDGKRADWIDDSSIVVFLPSGRSAELSGPSQVYSSYAKIIEAMQEGIKGFEWNLVTEAELERSAQGFVYVGCTKDSRAFFYVKAVWLF